MTKDKEAKEAKEAKDAKDAKEQHDIRTFDTRILERNMKRGLISRKEFEKYLKGLGDSKDKVRPTED